MPQKTQNKTERIRKRLEEIKAAARPAARPAEPEVEHQDVDVVDVPLTESDVKPAAVKQAEVGAEEFVLDGAAKFVMSVDGERLVGQYRINDASIVVNDPVVGYTSSVPITLVFGVTVAGVGRLVDLEKSNITIPKSLKLRNGTVSVSMAVPLSLPRVAWRTARRSVVWAIVQYQPLKSTWRVLRLKSTPRQTIYEAQQIMRELLGESAYTKLKEAVELLVTPL